MLRGRLLHVHEQNHAPEQEFTSKRSSLLIRELAIAFASVVDSVLLNQPVSRSEHHVGACTVTGCVSLAKGAVALR